MLDILYEVLSNNEDFSLSAQDCARIISVLLNVNKDDLSQVIDTDSLEETYDYAYNNGIRINEIIWQEYQDLDTTTDDMYLIHGSRSGIRGPIRLDVSGESNDFSNGFYCGTTIKQAGMFVASEPEASLYIVSFNPRGLKAARFNVDTDWMLAVAYYRDRIPEYANHPKVRAIVNRVNKCDYVIAPIADNNMFEIIDAFTEGTITDKQCLYALSTTNLGMQYVFKKDRCLPRLEIIEHLYLCDSEKNDYQSLADIESSTSLNKALLAKKKFANDGLYINELLG